MTFNCNLLINIVEVTNRHDEDAIGLNISRNEVFEESSFHHTLRNEFNADLRKLRDLGFVNLTRNNVSLTSNGFDEAWS